MPVPPGNLVLLWGDPELGGKSLGEMARTGKSAQIRYFGDVFSLFVEKPSGALQTLQAQDAEDSVLEEHPEQGRQPCAVDPHGGCQFGQARWLSDILKQYGIGSVRGPALRRADAFVAVFPVQEFDLLIEQFVFLVRQEYVSQEAVVPAVEDLLEENAKVQRDVSFEGPG